MILMKLIQFMTNHDCFIYNNFMLSFMVKFLKFEGSVCICITNYKLKLIDCRYVNLMFAYLFSCL